MLELAPGEELDESLRRRVCRHVGGARELGVAREHQLTPLRGEAASAATLSGLNNDGVALRRTRHGERAARAEMPALVVETAHLFRVGETSGRLVDDGTGIEERVVLGEDRSCERVPARMCELQPDQEVAIVSVGLDVCLSRLAE